MLASTLGQIGQAGGVLQHSVPPSGYYDTRAEIAKQMTPITSYVLLAVTVSVFLALFVGFVFLIRALVKGVGKAMRKRDRAE